MKILVKKLLKQLWYDWLIHYIPELIRKSESDFKDKVSLFKTNTPKQTVYRRREKLSKPKTLKH